MSDEKTRADKSIDALARLFGVADIPWFFRWAIGITIVLFILYFFMILHKDFADPEGARSLEAWILDGIKVVFGVIIGIISQSAGLHSGASNNIPGRQQPPATPP